jgi:HD superfamily phosphohydrolase
MILYRDVVHGDILLSSLDTDLIDTPEFQRLGRIMQLGFAHLVFRGATHTRFAHGVGCCHVARDIVRHVEANHARLGLPLPESLVAGRRHGLNFSRLSEIVSAAALVHDITHIPFGHTLEDEFQDIYLKHDALDSPRLWTLLWDPRSGLARVFDRQAPYVTGLDNATLRWLIYLILAFRQDGDADPPASFTDLLAQAQRRAAEYDLLDAKGRLAFAEFLGRAATVFADLTARGLFSPFMADIVSGTISADLLDYTARDLHHTGLGGGFDRRIMHYLFIARDGRTGEHRLALDVLSPRGYARLDITSEIMHLMRLRYSMAERVYYHRGKVAASAMLARGLLGHDVPADTNPFDDPRSVLQPELSDEEMVRRLIHAVDRGSAAPGALAAAEARELGRAILNRTLYVPAAALTATVAREIGGATRYADLLRGRPDGRRRLSETQAALSAMTGLGAHSVLLYCPPIKMQAKAIGMPVRFEDRRIVPLGEHPDFRDEAEQLNRKYQGLWKAFAFVHPDVLRTPGLVGRIVGEFCRRLDIPASFIPRIIATDYMMEEQGEGPGA